MKNSGYGCHAENRLTFDRKGTSLEKLTLIKPAGASQLLSFSPQRDRQDKNLVCVYSTQISQDSS